MGDVINVVVEIAEIEVLADRHEDFERGVGEAVALFRAAKGCHHARLERSVDHPDRYYLFVTWETVEDHMVTFRGSSEFARWRELVGHFFAKPPRVDHTSVVLTGF